MAAVNSNVGGGGVYGAGRLNNKEIGGAIGNGSAPNYNDANQLSAGVGYTAAAAAAQQGICVGSGVAAESFEDFALQTPITNGVGAGQLSYVASNVYIVVYNAGTRTLSATMARFMNNNSGGNVAVNEVVLVTTGKMAGSGAWMANSRDVLGATVTIPNTGQLKVTYVVSLVYPA